MPESPSRFLGKALAIAALLFVGLLGLLCSLSRMLPTVATLVRSGQAPTAVTTSGFDQPSTYPTDTPSFNRPTTVSAPAVIVNGVVLDHMTLSMLASAYNRQLPRGRYWYDPATGFWGYEGAPVAGITLSGLDFGARLRADASAGDTGVFLNGRELPRPELYSFAVLLGVLPPPGHYYLDAAGNLADEAGNVVNLVAMARQQAEWASGQPAGSSGGASDPLLFSSDGCTVIGTDFSCSSTP
jgi:hypothetical protein